MPGARASLTHVACDVTHNKRHAEDCADRDTGAPKTDVFRREIRLAGALAPEERTALPAIADKCPVRRTLHGQAIIETAAV